MQIKVIVECKFTSGKDLPNDARSRGETDRTDFSFLKKGKQYSVYGLMFLKNRVDLLVHASDGGGPNWLPSDLFDMVDSSVPSFNLQLTAHSKDYRDLYSQFGITAILGYPELVSNIEHYVGILERDSFHLSVFFNQKRLIDQADAFRCNRRSNLPNLGPEPRHRENWAREIREG